MTGGISGCSHIIWTMLFDNFSHWYKKVEWSVWSAYSFNCDAGVLLATLDVPGGAQPSQCGQGSTLCGCKCLIQFNSVAGTLQINPSVSLSLITSTPPAKNTRPSLKAVKEGPVNFITRSQPLGIRIITAWPPANKCPAWTWWTSIARHVNGTQDFIPRQAEGPAYSGVPKL